MKVTIDLETASLVDIKKVGGRNYANHPSTIITTMSWKVLGQEEVYSLVMPGLSTRSVCPDALQAVDYIFKAKKLIAHNAAFECDMFNSKLDIFLGEFGLEARNRTFKLDNFNDTQTLALIYRGPPSLKDACKFFNLPELKDELGQKVMKIVCKLRDTEPRNKKTVCQKMPAYWVPLTHGRWAKGGPQVYEIMRRYCEQDVIATEKLFIELTKKSRLDEMGEFLPEIVMGIKATNAMNEAGVNIDPVFSKKIIENKEKIEDKFDQVALKNFGVDGGAKREVIKRAIKEMGYDIEKLGQKDLTAWIHYNKPPEEFANKLREYCKYNTSALKKALKAEMTKSSDGKVYGMFKFCGASENGRWASYGMQLQNLPRPKYELKEVESFIKSDECPLIDPDKTVSAIRAMIVPSKGKKFFVADLAQIEFRVALYLAGYTNKLDELAAGNDLYKEMAANQFKIKQDEVNDRQRYVGKQTLLSCQYGQGAAKFRHNLAAEGQVYVDLIKAKEFIDKYRMSYRRITDEWQKYDRQLTLSVGKEFKVKLLTGRWLNYGKITRRRVTCPKTKQTRMQFFYKSGKMYKSIYGASVFQHVVSASARDIILMKINDLHRLGDKLVMTVHDEVVLEVNKDEKLDKWEKNWHNSGMNLINKYFPGLPLESDCSFTHRYYK